MRRIVTVLTLSAENERKVNDGRTSELDHFPDPARQGDHAEIGRSIRAAAGAYLSARGYELSQKSRQNITSTLEAFIDHCGNVPVGSLEESDVASWLSHRAGRVGPASLRANQSHLSAFTRWLVKTGWLKTDPCSNLGKIKVPRGQPRDLTPDEILKTLLACPDPRARAIWLVFVSSGLRVSELAGLEVGDIDWHKGLLFVQRGKGGHQRFAPISEEALQALRVYLAGSPAPSGPLFRSYLHVRSWMHPNYIGSMVREWLYAAGVKVAPKDRVSAHAARHSFAAEMLDMGADLRLLQHALGHAQISTTAVYAEQHQNVERLANLERRRYEP